MFIYPEINPIAISIGPIQIAWYGLMYLLGFMAAFWLAKIRIKTAWSPIHSNQLEDLIFYSAIGVIIGGRLGYMIFYDLNLLFSDPISWIYRMPRIWEGGMSFHGGFLGVIFAVILFSRKIKEDALALIDFVAPLVPIGLGLGRMGNFINNELWGKPTDSILGFLVDNVIRHPTQIYEAFLEGIVLFVILNFSLPKKTRTSQVTAFFLIFYSLFRFIVEFFREPDAHIGYLVFS